jgi:hypothetical protein
MEIPPHQVKRRNEIWISANIFIYFVTQRIAATKTVWTQMAQIYADFDLR